MTIHIPSKSDKLRSQLVDSLRILSWKQYKIDNKDSELKGLDLYELFNNEWKEHEIHKMNMTQLKKFIKELEYTDEELMNIRSEYYQARKDYDYESTTTKHKNENELDVDEHAPF